MDNKTAEICRLILIQFLGQELSKAEKRVLREWQSQSPYNEEILQLFKQKEWVSKGLREIDSFPREKVKAELYEKIAKLEAGRDDDGWQSG